MKTSAIKKPGGFFSSILSSAPPSAFSNAASENKNRPPQETAEQSADKFFPPNGWQCRATTAAGHRCSRATSKSFPHFCTQHGKIHIHYVDDDKASDNTVVDNEVQEEDLTQEEEEEDLIQEEEEKDENVALEERARAAGIQKLFVANGGQCRAATAAGKRCSRNVHASSEHFCYQHENMVSRV
jgi:hypothetical protein